MLSALQLHTVVVRISFARQMSRAPTRYFGSGGGGRGRGGGSGRGGGGGGRGGGRGRRGFAPRASANEHELRSSLVALDGQSYGAYNDVQNTDGTLFDAGFRLFFDRMQTDPFAPPSNVRVVLPRALANIPDEWLTNKTRLVAVADYLTRSFWHHSRDVRDGAAGGGFHSEKGGALRIDRPNQNVLQRSSVVIDAEHVECRFTLSLPAQGRRILGQKAAQLVCDALPRLVQRSLLFAALDAQQFAQHVLLYEDQEHVRAELARRGLVAFVRDDSVLPRLSGASDLPLPRAVPFRAPPSLRVAIETLHHGTIQGLGVRAGITVVVGGAFHGKSTLLNALKLGVYAKIGGDGREWVISNANAVSIRAEDGRFIAKSNISEFINNLPLDKDTTEFSTDDASGSTSQAANIVEALEACGTTTLLIDEDQSATNFMFRDSVMAQLVQHEPITPFVHRIRPMADRGVSVVLVLGSTSTFFSQADTIIKMDSYLPVDVTEQGKALCVAGTPDGAAAETVHEPLDTRRCVVPHSLRALRDAKIYTTATKQLSFKGAGDDGNIDLAACYQIVGESQIRAIGRCLQFVFDYATNESKSGQMPSVQQCLQALECRLEQQGLDALPGFFKAPNLTRPRMIDVACALNRCRLLNIDVRRVVKRSKTD